MKEAIQAVEAWIDDRPTIKENNTLDALRSLMIGEAEELLEEGANLTEETADVMIYAISIFRHLAVEAGVDTETFIQQAVMEKVAMNHLQYEAHRFADGDYEEQRKISKTLVYKNKLKENFYGNG